TPHRVGESRGCRGCAPSASRLRKERSTTATLLPRPGRGAVPAGAGPVAAATAGAGPGGDRLLSPAARFQRRGAVTVLILDLSSAAPVPLPPRRQVGGEPAGRGGGRRERRG